jgi:hypothetical protein
MAFVFLSQIFREGAELAVLLGLTVLGSLPVMII